MSTDAPTRLDREQLGHLRHIRNLANQPDNDWSMMAAARPLQEDFGAYRYQLAYMFLTLAVAHRHHLPAAPGAFRPVMDRLIQKMLLPEVWAYWRDTSAGGNPAMPDMPQPTQSDDPVASMNIMYSGYVQLMSLMYHYLFDDPKYAEPGAITFRMRPMFWGGDGFRFEYDEQSLNDHIYWQMAESGFLGVACEPGMVFQICNQVPIISFRLHDFIFGTELASDVAAAYLQAWQDFGVLTEDGHYNAFVMDWRGQAVPGALTAEQMPRAPVWDAWCGLLMHSWNPGLVETQYRTGIDAFIERGGNYDLSLKVSDALLGDAHAPEHGVTTHGHFGFVTCWAAEVGDLAVRDGLLRYADRYMKPTWRDGGLYYPRQDTPFDKNGNYSLMEPLSGNALLALARLLPSGGLRSIYEHRWSDDRFAQPALREVNDALDVLVAEYDAATGRLEFTLAPHRDADVAEVDVRIGPFDPDADLIALARAMTLGKVEAVMTDDAMLHLKGHVEQPQAFRLECFAR